jgi:hypothetical protein
MSGAVFPSHLDEFRLFGAQAEKLLGSSDLPARLLQTNSL